MHKNGDVEIIVFRPITQKVKKEMEAVENKLGLSWAKLSLSWGLKIEFEVDVELQIVIVA